MFEPTSTTATRIARPHCAVAVGRSTLERCAARSCAGGARALRMSASWRRLRGRSPFSGAAAPSSRPAELPGLCVVGEQRVERGGRAAAGRAVLDRRDDLEPVVEVARHQVGAAEEYVVRFAGLEDGRRGCARGSGRATLRTRMFSLSPGTPGRSVQMLRATMSISAPGLRGGVELLDDRLVGERVHLDPDPRRLASPRPPAATARISSMSRVAEVERRDEQLAEPLRPPEAGQVVEEVGDVGGDLLVGREEPEVLVEARRDGVVVAGADVDVAAQPVALAPDDERRLRVDLQVREAVDDVDARPLERSRPLDVAALVEARLQLDEADALLARPRPPRSAPARAASRRSSGTRSSSARSRRGSSAARAHERLEARRRTSRTGGGRARRLRRISAKSSARASISREPRLRHRHPRLVLQLGPVERGELDRVGEVEQPRIG